GFFIINNVLIESNGHSVSYGRFDQNLYPYYQQDMATGNVSQDFIQELIESAIIKFCGYMKLRSWKTTQDNSGRGLGGLTLTLGGVDSAGQDATNILSYMCLDALAHTQMGQSWVMVRLHEDTPKDFLNKAVSVIKIGTGEPKMINDQLIIRSMQDRGRSLEEARNYSIAGLVEAGISGCEYSWHDAAYFSIARVLELSLNNGRPLTGEYEKAVGPATGSLADFQTFEQLQHAFEEQMAHWVERMVEDVNVVDRAHQALKPLPYLSLLIDDCIDNGVDVSAGGARYNFSGVQAVGVATVADSLATIKQLVFDEKKISGQKLLDALQDNWEGHDYLYALVNGRKVHHYGNDDAYADELARYAVDIWCQEVTGRPNAHGGVFQPGVFSVSSNVSFGKAQGATPDGRKAGEPLADGISPVHTALGSHDTKGITAVINSAASLNQEAASNGMLFNLKIQPGALQGDQANINLISLIKSYFRRGGMHLQVSVTSREILEDADRHPQKYRGLLVYVAGYSTLWCELGDSLKQDILNRTELSFDGNSDLTPPS
ncbi:MAG: formate C-acetyltransferase/glycerol dehydratase family glycyl radical enzyme, partial [Deltaproteobacteria bacterium]|nr:formate C-acetyltransferase/glycerol dehydratase family glycyl radical enzyme [Deltaproteobacteria bacterium]